MALVYMCRDCSPALQKSELGVRKCDRISKMLERLGRVGRDHLLLLFKSKIGRCAHLQWTRRSQTKENTTVVPVLVVLVGNGILSRSKKVHQSRQFRVLGRKSAGKTKPNGPQGGLWVC